MALAWNNTYKLGFRIIDQQHEGFINTLNDLINTMNTIPQDKAVIDSVFSRIQTYAHDHFATEEKYFQEFHYEGAAEHIAKHEEFKQTFNRIKQQYLTDTMSATFNLAEFLENWLLDHLNTMDKKYVQCFRDHGLQ